MSRSTYNEEKQVIHTNTRQESDYKTHFSVGLFSSMPLCECEMCWASAVSAGLRGPVLGMWLPAPLPTPRALPDHGAIWPLAVGVENDLGGIDVWPCGIVCCSLCGLTHPPSIEARRDSWIRLNSNSGYNSSSVRLCVCSFARIYIFSLYKILFHFKALLWESIVLSFTPPPLAKPILLQYFCTTIAQYTPPYRPPFCKPYTIQHWWWQCRVKAKYIYIIGRARVNLKGALQLLIHRYG